MQLYKKVPHGKTFRYVPAETPSEPSTRCEMELDNGQVATLAATIGMCVLISLERHLPDHSALGRKIRAVEDAIVALARLAGTTLDRKMTDAGTVAWGAAVHRLAEELAKGEEK